MKNVPNTLAVLLFLFILASVVNAAKEFYPGDISQIDFGNVERAIMLGRLTDLVLVPLKSLFSFINDIIDAFYSIIDGLMTFLTGLKGIKLPTINIPLPII